MLRHGTVALAEHVRALEADLSTAETWDARYEAFERFCRFKMYGEPPPPEQPPDASSFVAARFWPKLRPLRDALRTFEQHMTGIDPSWTVFGTLVPAVLRSASSLEAEQSAPPTMEDGRVRIPSERALALCGIQQMNETAPGLRTP